MSMSSSNPTTANAPSPSSRPFLDFGSVPSPAAIKSGSGVGRGIGCGSGSGGGTGGTGGGGGTEGTGGGGGGTEGTGGGGTGTAGGMIPALEALTAPLATTPFGSS